MSSLPTAQQVALGATASMALYWLWNYWTTSNRAPYPPGPMPLPLLGSESRNATFQDPETD